MTQHSPPLSRVYIETLARQKAGRKSHFHIRPRYTGGSPAMIELHEVVRVAVQECDAWERCLTGVYGDAAKLKAEKLGLRGIAYARWESRGKVWRLDLLSGEIFVEAKRLGWDDRQRVSELRALSQVYRAQGLAFCHAAELDLLEQRLDLHGESFDGIALTSA